MAKSNQLTPLPFKGLSCFSTSAQLQVMLVYCLVSRVPKSNSWHKGLLLLFSTWFNGMSVAKSLAVQRHVVLLGQMTSVMSSAGSTGTRSEHM